MWCEFCIPLGRKAWNRMECTRLTVDAIHVWRGPSLTDSLTPSPLLFMSTLHTHMLFFPSHCQVWSTPLSPCCLGQWWARVAKLSSAPCPAGNTQTDRMWQNVTDRQLPCCNEVAWNCTRSNTCLILLHACILYVKWGHAVFSSLWFNFGG